MRNHSTNYLIGKAYDESDQDAAAELVRRGCGITPISGRYIVSYIAPEAMGWIS